MKENTSQPRCLQCDVVIANMPYTQQKLNKNRKAAKKQLKLSSEVFQTTGDQDVTLFLCGEAKTQSPGDDFNGTEPKKVISISRWLRKCDENGQVTTSSKMKVAIQIIEEWLRSNPDDQIVVFTEWMGTSRVLGRLLNRSKIKFVYYNGGVSIVQREKNLGDFKKYSEIKVMVCFT